MADKKRESESSQASALSGEDANTEDDNKYYETDAWDRIFFYTRPFAIDNILSML